MSGYGKLNLLGIFSLPVIATLTAVIMFGPRADTMVTVFGLNKAGGVGRSIALWPTMIPAATGIVWYLWDALFPAELDPGRVYIAGPQYLVMGAIATGIVAWLLCIFVRSRRDTV